VPPSKKGIVGRKGGERDFRGGRITKKNFKLKQKSKTLAKSLTAGKKWPRRTINHGGWGGAGDVELSGNLF